MEATWLDPGNERSVRWMPVVLLSASAVIATIQVEADNVKAHYLPAALIITGAALVWTLAYHPYSRKHANPTVYYVVRLALTAVLVGLNPWFGIYAWSAYVEAPRLFTGKWVWVALAAAAPVASASYLGGYPTSFRLGLLWLVLMIGSIALVGSITSAVLKSNEREEERERMFAEVTVANQRLEEALAENRGLQSQLLIQAREAGALDERARLAGEIHDTLAQALTGIIRQLEAASRSGELAPGERPHLDLAAELAHEGLSEARRSLRALRPGQLEGSTLPDAITDVAKRASLPVDVEVTGASRTLPTDQEVVLLRVVQEALTNVGKHAEATRVGVTLTYVQDAVILDVRDDGVGFDPQTVGVRTDGTGVGLAAMRDRLDRISGSLVVESAPGEGTALVATVPCAASVGAA
jgi:signal transduction histidine kinase